MVKLFLVIITAQVVLFDTLLVSVCILCERLLLFANGRWQAAIIDNAIHASIAGIAWLAVNGDRIMWRTITQGIVCAFMSSVIDADHFIAASSLSLEVAIKTSWLC
jgi:hypothetical protein